MSGAGERGLSLTDKVQYLPGVGPRRAEQLGRLGINTVGSLLEYLPLRHERNESLTVENLEEDVVATIVGEITAVSSRWGRGGPTVTATLTDNTGRCSLRWFNAGWVRDRLRWGMIIRATGKVREYRQAPQMVNPRFVVLGADAQPVDESEPVRFEGVYPATAEMPSRMVARLSPPAGRRAMNCPSRPSNELR